MSTLGAVAQPAAGSPRARLFFPLVALGLILLFDLIFVPGFFTLEVKDGHLYGSLVDILRNSVPTVMLLAIGHDARDRHRRRRPVGRRGHGDLGLGRLRSSSTPDRRGRPAGNITTVVGDPTFSFAPLPVVILVPLFVATLCGVWNGVLVAYGGIQPMVATLILMIAGRGIAQLITNGDQDPASSTSRSRSSATAGSSCRSRCSSSPCVFVVAWLLTRRTALGLFIESVGINARSSFYSGINEKRIKLFAYTFCGFCAGIAGLDRGLEHPDLGRQQDRPVHRARRDPRGRHRRDRCSGPAAGSRCWAASIGALVIQATTTSMYAIGVPASAITRDQGASSSSS